MVGARHISVVIAAGSVGEAFDKAAVLGHELIQRRLPWLMENGRTRPPIEPRDLTVDVGEPIELHHARSHR
jgi:hypothetical protein